ncbi:hypothetical protein AYI69_g8114, partial [Smittium culicis]
MALNTTSKAS